MQLTVLVYFPGYITVDARYVYADAKLWQFGDWQSPAMGVLWRLIDPIAPGPLSMFLLPSRSTGSASACSRSLRRGDRSGSAC